MSKLTLADVMKMEGIELNPDLHTQIYLIPKFDASEWVLEQFNRHIPTYCFSRGGRDWDQLRINAYTADGKRYWYFLPVTVREINSDKGAASFTKVRDLFREDAPKFWEEMAEFMTHGVGAQLPTWELAFEIFGTLGGPNFDRLVSLQRSARKLIYKHQD